MRMNSEQIRAYNAHRKQQEIDAVMKDVLEIIKICDPKTKDRISKSRSEGDLETLKKVVAKEKAKQGGQPESI